MLRISNKVLQQLKLAAALTGQTMREIAETAIATQLDKIEKQHPELGPLRRDPEKVRTRRIKK